MTVHECLRAGVHIILHLLQHLPCYLRQLSESYNSLLTGVAAYQNALTGLDILRSDLNTQRDSAHLLLAELPARALVGIIYLYLEACLLQLAAQLLGLLQNAFLVLGDRDDHDLRGRDAGRQYQAAVVAVYHDDCADDTSGHRAPANFSLSVLRPLMTGMARTFSQKSAYTFSIIMVRSSASS